MVVAALAGMVVLGVFAAGVGCWALAFLRLAGGVPLVAWRERRPVPWAVADLVGAVALYIVAMMLVGLVLRQMDLLPGHVDQEKMTLDQRKVLVWANIGASALLLLLGLPMIAWRSRATGRDLGWSPSTLLADLRLGLIGFFMLAPPVYLVQAILVQFWPSKHPLMEMFRGTPDPWFFAVLFLAAVVVAPLFEELVFRVLLQGFLEKVCTFRGQAHELIFGSPHVGQAASLPPIPTMAAAPVDAAIVADLAPHVAPLPSPLDPQPPLAGWIAWIPIVLSSLIFAFLHEWPDQVPLVMLAVGMGYLYQRTHSIVPSLVVHLMLNGLSMIGLWVQVYEMPEKVLSHWSLVIGR